MTKLSIGDESVYPKSHKAIAFLGSESNPYPPSEVIFYLLFPQ